MDSPFFMANKFKNSFLPALRFVFLMWLFFSIEVILGFDLAFLGIYPREVNGLIGIVTAPLVHGSLNHIISNTFPILFLSGFLYLFYNSIANQVFIQTYLLTNFFVWLLARPSFHIGASGLVYAFAAFLIAIGIFRKDFKSLLVAIAVVLLYGGLVYGLFPVSEGVSWESHLLGAVAGVGTAWGFSKKPGI